MGAKLLWVGLTILLATKWLVIPASDVVGSIIMILGLLLYLLDK